MASQFDESRVFRVVQRAARGHVRQQALHLLQGCWHIALRARHLRQAGRGVVLRSGAIHHDVAFLPACLAQYIVGPAEFI